MRHRPRPPARILRLAAAAIALAAITAATSASGAPRTVHFRGTAYEFNRTGHRLGGATIRVAEFPRIRARTRANGTYDLRVPARATVTPYIQASGFHTIYLQTFTTNGGDLANVNFQTPSNAVYRALAVLLDVPLDRAGNPKRCAIVSTFSTRNVRDLSYAQFIAYGAHGVAGATASGRPSLPRAVYFNENVIPDRTQRVSSKDGGVVWTDVRTGVYTISAHHPSTRFAGFVATCKPGRIVNANPPWGLHELGLANRTVVSAGWAGSRAPVTLRSLRAAGLPPNAVLRLACSGPRCPFARRTANVTAGAVDILGALGLRAPVLRLGDLLTLTVSAHAHDTKVVEWGIGATRIPRAVTRCIRLGDAGPLRAC